MLKLFSIYKFPTRLFYLIWFTWRSWRYGSYNNYPPESYRKITGQRQKTSGATLIRSALPGYSETPLVITMVIPMVTPMIQDVLWKGTANSYRNKIVCSERNACTLVQDFNVINTTSWTVRMFLHVSRTLIPIRKIYRAEFMSIHWGDEMRSDVTTFSLKIVTLV